MDLGHDTIRKESWFVSIAKVGRWCLTGMVVVMGYVESLDATPSLRYLHYSLLMRDDGQYMTPEVCAVAVQLRSAADRIWPTLAPGEVYLHFFCTRVSDMWRGFTHGLSGNNTLAHVESGAAKYHKALSKIESEGTERKN